MEAVRAILKTASEHFKEVGDYKATLNLLVNEFYTLGIRVRFAAVPEPDRFLLTFDGRWAHDFYKLRGSVFSFPEMVPLAVSMPSLTINPRARDVCSALSKKALVYPIHDGTMITLYFWDGKWRMSSANGFEVNDYKWMSETTYEEAFTAAVAAHPHFAMERLDKDLCYSISFRHPSFHPLLSDPLGAILLQAMRPADALADDGDWTGNLIADIGLPIQSLLPAPVNFAALIQENNQSLTRYRKQNDYVPVYGFVVRPIDGSQGMILESTLLRKVRQLIYTLPKQGKSAITIAPGSSGTDYCVIRAYLNSHNKDLFIELFPQFTDSYERYDKFLEKLADRLVSALRNKNIRSNIMEHVVAEGMAEVDLCAAQLIDHLEHVDPFEPVTESIIADFIRDPFYTNMFYKALHN